MRNFEAGETYHLDNSHYHKKRLFFDDSDVERFRKGLYKCADKYDVEVIAASVMDNHFHLLVMPRGKGDVSKFMMSLQRGYAQYLNIKYRRSGQVFARRYFSKHVSTEEYLRNVKQYIWSNPVDRLLLMQVVGMRSWRTLKGNPFCDQ